MTQSVKLISEEIQDVEYICAQKEDGKKNYKIKGIFMQADIKNRNGRVYPMDVLNKEVERYNKQYVNEKRAFGELGHPEGPTVNLDKVSHMITKLYPDGKNFIGEAKIMSTPMGEMSFTWRLQLILLQTLPLQKHLYMVLWREKSGFGTMEHSLKQN